MYTVKCLAIILFFVAAGQCTYGCMYVQSEHGSCGGDVCGMNATCALVCCDASMTCVYAGPGVEFGDWRCQYTDSASAAQGSRGFSSFSPGLGMGALLQNEANEVLPCVLDVGEQCGGDSGLCHDRCFVDEAWRNAGDGLCCKTGLTCTQRSPGIWLCAV